MVITKGIYSQPHHPDLSLHRTVPQLEYFRRIYGTDQLRAFHFFWNRRAGIPISMDPGHPSLSCFMRGFDFFAPPCLCHRISCLQVERALFCHWNSRPLHDCLVTVQNIFPGVSFPPPQYLSNYSLVPIYYMALTVAVITIGLVSFLKPFQAGSGSRFHSRGGGRSGGYWNQYL